MTRSSKPLIGLSGQICADLRDRIINNEIPPGTHLVIEELSRECNVSITPVRTALQTLEKDGLVRIIPNVGAFVTELRLREIKEICEVRRALEDLAVGLATARVAEDATKSDALRSMLAEYRNGAAQVRQHIKPPFELDLKFHDFVLEAADNKTLMTMMALMRNQMYRVRHLIYAKKAEIRQDIQEHIDIAKAIIENQPMLARELMGKHIDRTRDLIMTHLAEGGEALIGGSESRHGSSGRRSHRRPRDST